MVAEGEGEGGGGARCREGGVNRRRVFFFFLKGWGGGGGEKERKRKQHKKTKIFSLLCFIQSNKSGLGFAQSAFRGLRKEKKNETVIFFHGETKAFTQVKRFKKTRKDKNKTCALSFLSLSFLSLCVCVHVCVTPPYATLGLLVVLATNPALIGATVLEAPQAWQRRNMIRELESRSSSESGDLQLLQRTYSLT